ncbi:MAG: glutamate racemase [Coriobacteriales bacterium]|jgi:glutamate racemase|nr:glutamate racemase [Coriobacteriales bacterium]
MNTIYGTGTDEAARPGSDAAALPIGVFDSGVGGLTVVREIVKRLPQESILYFGDTLRCPYGPRPLEEIRGFARQITAWLSAQGVKMIVVACNSATAAALTSIQRESSVPVIGVVEPGARAAVQATISRRVGIIGTTATIDSDIYNRAIHALDTGVMTFSTATPRFVEMVEQGLRLDRMSLASGAAAGHAAYDCPPFVKIAHDYLDPLRRCDIDTLVLGCTHYPLLTPLIRQIMGAQVRIISSATETVRDVAETLDRRGQLAPSDTQPCYHFASTTAEGEDFARFGQVILERPIGSPRQVMVHELEEALQDFRTRLRLRTAHAPA